MSQQTALLLLFLSIITIIHALPTNNQNEEQKPNIIVNALIPSANRERLTFYDDAGSMMLHRQTTYDRCYSFTKTWQSRVSSLKILTGDIIKLYQSEDCKQDFKTMIILEHDDKCLKDLSICNFNKKANSFTIHKNVKISVG
jgi:hypothetical protein